MPRTFKQWTPATAELELLHECWLARLAPARIAAQLGIAEPKLKRFMRRVHAARDMPRPEPARPRHQASSSDAGEDPKAAAAQRFNDHGIARRTAALSPWRPCQSTASATAQPSARSASGATTKAMS